MQLSSKGCASASPFLLAAGIDSLDKLGSTETLGSLEMIGVSVVDAGKLRRLFFDGGDGAAAGGVAASPALKSAKQKVSRVRRLFRVATAFAGGSSSPIPSPSSSGRGSEQPAEPESPGGYVKRPSRGFAPVDPKMPTFAGWLEKKAESSKILGWQKRWFCVNGYMLKYYRRTFPDGPLNESDLLAGIDIRCATDITLAGEGADGVDEDAGQDGGKGVGEESGDDVPCVLTIVLTARNFHLRAPTRSAAKEWIRVLLMRRRSSWGIYRIKKSAAAKLFSIGNAEGAGALSEEESEAVGLWATWDGKE